MYKFSSTDLLLLYIGCIPFLFWYIVLPVFIAGILLMYFNRNKREKPNNRTYYKLGKFTVILILIDFIISVFALLAVFN